MNIKDQMHREIVLSSLPMRIVSLVPSQTEYLHALGLGDRVVGITKFCIHPDDWFRNKTRIGGTKSINIDQVAALQPDLIIGNKEENTKSDIEQLESLAPVWMSDIYTLEDSYRMMLQIGQMVGEVTHAKRIVEQIKSDFIQLESDVSLKKLKGKRVLYLIWKDPFMGCAKETFIHHILEEVLGFENSLSEYTRYPEVTDLKSCETDYIFLSSEPYPFKEKHVKEIQELNPNANVKVVDGEYFSWYGSRLMGAAVYFKTLIADL
jgi:ABC-type Fe3+-hydroxamate transport system substrate-binding protein